MKSLTLMLAIVLLLSLFWIVEPAHTSEGLVNYPSGYRSWQHVKSMIIQPGHPLADSFGGIHHIYANAAAMRGLTGGQYDDGAVFVFDLLDYKNRTTHTADIDRKQEDANIAKENHCENPTNREHSDRSAGTAASSGYCHHSAC